MSRYDTKEERLLKAVRREAVRPLRKMLAETGFRVVLMDLYFDEVFIDLNGWRRRISWEDCGNREVVRRLQDELLECAEDWLSRAYDGLVSLDKETQP